MNRAEILRLKVTRLIQLLVAKKIQVTQRGSQAYVEWDKITKLPKRVNIPYIPDDAPDDFIAAIEGFLDHEVGHVLFTDANEVARAHKFKVADLANIIEDIYIERRMSEEFVGSRINLYSVGDFFLRNYTAPNVKKNPKEAVSFLMVPAMRSWGGQAVFTDFMNDGKYWGAVDKIAKKIESYCKSVLPNLRDSAHVTDVAIEIMKMLKEPPPPKGIPNGGKGDTPEDKGESDNDTPSTSDEGEPEETDKSESENPSKSEKGEPKDSDEPDEGEDELEGKSDDAEPEDKEGDADGDKDGSDKDSEGDSEGDSGKGDEADDTSDGDNEQDGESDTDDETGIESSSAQDAEGDHEPDGEDANEGEPEEGESSEGESEEEGEQQPEPESASSGDEAAGGKPADSETLSTGDAEEPEPFEPIDLAELLENMKDFDDAISEILTKDSIDYAKNADYIVYTKEQDFVGTLPDVYINGVPDSYVTTMQDKVDHMVGSLQKDLERAVAARSQAIWTGGHKKGRINANALSRLVNHNDDRIFKQKQNAQTKSTAVSLLVDCSGSMRGTAIATAAYTAYALASVLERLSVKCEVSGFTTGSDIRFDSNDKSAHSIRYSRGSALFLPIFKGFNERLDMTAKKRIASLAKCQFMMENVDGESVEVVGNRLLQRSEERKILIVLSDGLPACTPGVTSHLNANLATVVAKFEKGGVDVLGIGIEDDSVKRFYKKHVVIQNVSELPTRVIGEVKNLLMK